MNAFEMKGVSKAWPGFELKDVDLALPEGCIMGLIGENGAGKSTTIRLLLDMLRADSGEIMLLGERDGGRIPRLREQIGVVLDEVGVPTCLTARQTGKVMSGIFHSWDADAYNMYLKRLSVPTDKAFGDFSRGMKMKLGIALALSHHARLLILDEETSGLDPVIRDEILDIFNDFTRDEGCSILISSHIVSDLEKICDYVSFLHKGRLLLSMEKDELRDSCALIHCDGAELSSIPRELIVGTKKTPYGVDAIVKRSAVPAGLAASPVDIEQLFIFMVKEADAA